MSTLTASKFITFRKSPNLIQDFQGCGINSLMTLLDTASSSHTITVDDCKRIFAYDKEEGISVEKYRFSKFNNHLKEHKLPYKGYMNTFNSHQELLKYLHFPVPVFFSMKVIKFIKDKFKYSLTTFNFGDENLFFENPNHHLLLLVGYENSGELLYFIDPVYQLPYYTTKDLEDKEKMCVLNTTQFYECVKSIKSFIEFRFMKKLEKTYKTERIKSDKQKRLS